MRSKLLTLIYIGVLLPSGAVTRPAASFVQGVYMCRNAFWSNSSHDPKSQCRWLQYRGPTCIQLWTLPDYQRWYRQVSSYGPDPGLTCTVHDGDGCTGFNETFVYPGVADLTGVGWNDRIASYRCKPYEGA